MISPITVAKAYAAVQNQAAAAAPQAAVEEKGGFGDLLKSAMTDAMKSSKTAETQIAKQVQGKAELIDVVTAISAAEASLETVMAVRDQVISAYQEIMRMPI
ncbi:flagellar hook-basal body complex protein FliE [Phenylobacterium sp.]|uniref:flagellar hook-basal body complex protein FliE n=1 Tax=Phenylobacterium sp. TaxID=1871053 RepID=UPI0027338828|nr:flagellar hook-basal body complex protein FliE [Phenylobacterium sp.]MDP3660043.1 flagellar hook-basal body complex protein FliE [Phenylobacterium sp.]